MSTRVAHSISEVRTQVTEARSRGLSIALVPTMGALHEGHGRLIERARAEAGFVVVTIFVNPIQFNDSGDYSAYARTLDTDVELCREQCVDLVFAPSVEEMYPRQQQTFVEIGLVTEHMEGRFRPGHFRGVATVVAKLFNIVQPDVAYFGEKDAQQVAVVRRMVEDLNFAVMIREVETVREPGGLAMSSRNRRLTVKQRQSALALYEALEAARKSVESGETSPAMVRRQAMAVLARFAELKPEYVEIVDAADMQPVESIARPVRVAAAAWVGETRLIDNVLARPKQG